MFFAQCIVDFSQEYGLVLALFLGGLFGSVTHCSGMCSPFILAQTGDVDIIENSKLMRISNTLLLPYHLGRLTTYVVLAAFFYGILNLAFLFGEMKSLLSGALLLTAGTVFLINVMPAAQSIFPWGMRLSLPVPLKWISRFSAPFLNAPSVFKRYVLGVILGFMPCGLVIAAIMAASTAPTLAQSVFAMVAFSVGTMPALIAVGLGGRTLQLKFPKLKFWLKPIAGAASALWLFILAGWIMT